MLKKLFSREDIEGAVKRLASMIEKDYDAEPIVFICLLKGSFMFTSDLVRAVTTRQRSISCGSRPTGTG